jgi:hypothetical protein
MLLIGAGTAVALVRLALWRRAAPAGETGPSWRFPTLVGLNLLVAALLYLTLDPPDVGVRSGRLVVLTAGASAVDETRTGDVIVALPEASASSAERFPDLATALRRHPEVRDIEVRGAGLTARDRPAVDRAVAFEPPAPPIGLTRLVAPASTTPGAPFAVSGAVGALAAGTVELADPSGAVIDRASVTSGSAFALRGAARASGLALFELRLKDAQGRPVERIDIPLEARDAPPPRVIVMAGAPGPEPRFLRRWAEGAGIDLSVRLALGAGVDLTARPTPLSSAALSETDLLVIDERRWDMLGAGERAAVRSAVASGMGLLLRPTGPLADATRRDWASLGASLTGGETLRPLTMDDDDAPDAEGGPSNEPVDTTPELSRRDFVPTGSQATVLIADADGNPLATWALYGEGRVGVWVVANSYALILTSQEDRYGAMWSRMISALARPEGKPRVHLQALARAGERAGLCGVEAGDVVLGPDGSRTRLVIDVRAGPERCAGFWPQRAGWHAVMASETERGVIYVHPADATPSLIAEETRQAMLDLETVPGGQSAADSVRRSGSPLPWFLALLLTLATLWWLERRRPATAPPSAV